MRGLVGELAAGADDGSRTPKMSSENSIALTLLGIVCEQATRFEFTMDDCHDE
jgi:hypothetical protein